MSDFDIQAKRRWRAQIRRQMVEASRDLVDDLREVAGDEESFAGAWEDLIMPEFLDGINDVEKINIIQTMSINVRNQIRREFIDVLQVANISKDVIEYTNRKINSTADNMSNVESYDILNPDAILELHIEKYKASLIAQIIPTTPSPAYITNIQPIELINTTPTPTAIVSAPSTIGRYISPMYGTSVPTLKIVSKNAILSTPGSGSTHNSILSDIDFNSMSNGALPSADGHSSIEFILKLITAQDVNKMKVLLDIAFSSTGGDSDFSNICYAVLGGYCKFSNNTEYVWNDHLKLWTSAGKDGFIIIMSSILNLYSVIHAEALEDEFKTLKHDLNVIGNTMEHSVESSFRSEFSIKPDDISAHDDRVWEMRRLIENRKDDIIRTKRVTRTLRGSGNMRSINNFFIKQVLVRNFESRLNKTHPHLLPIKDGLVVDMETGAMRVRLPSDMFSHECNATYDPNCTDTTVIDFITDVYGYDKELLNYIIKMLGYCMTGENPEQKMFIFHGETGSNAKSTLLGLINNFSNGLTEEINEKTIASNSGESQNSHSGNLQALEGLRAGTISEANSEMNINEAFVKRISGQDTISGRCVGSKEQFSFKSGMKLMIACNLSINLNADSTSLWRRIIIIPHKYTYTDARGRSTTFAELQDENIKILDSTLSERLLTKEAMSGFLNVIISGAMKYFKEGLEEPQIFVDAKEKFKASIDKLGSFINEHFDTAIEVSFRKCIPTSKFHSEYNRWLKENSYSTETAQHIKASMSQKGFISGKAGVDRYTRLVEKDDTFGVVYT